MAPLARSPTPDTMTFMTAILDHRSPTADQVFKTSMALSIEPPSSAIEPLPHINYFLVNHLIRLARPHITKHQLKRVEYVVDARRSFYEGHAKFQAAYRDLLDAYTCAQTLEKKDEELKKRLEDTLAVNDGSNQTANNTFNTVVLRNHIAAIETQRRINNDDMRVRLDALNAKTKSRQHVSAWFSELKVVFLRDEMPWLVALTKQLYQAAMSQEQQQQQQQESATTSATSATTMTTQPEAIAGSSASVLVQAPIPHTGIETLDGDDDDEWSGGDDGAEMEMEGFGAPFSEGEDEDEVEEAEGEGDMF